MPWRRTWTLNIDDAFERAYALSDRRKRASLTSINWVDEYMEAKGPEIIHLHGSIATKSPSPLIFSLSEYHAAAEAHGVWHKVLRGVLSSEPVVIVGARILDDTDIESLVLNARPRSAAPSIIVDPFISPENAFDLTSAGYIIYQGKADAWIDEWSDLFGLDPDNRRLLYADVAINLPQIDELRTDRVVPPPSSHDIFTGSEPLWSDACSNFIAPFEWTTSVVHHIAQWAVDETENVFVRVLYVRRLAGVTAGLYSIAVEVAKLGIRAFRFNRSVRFSPQLVLDMCRGAGPIVLFIDGGYAFTDDVDRLAALANEDPDVKLYIALGDRPSSASLIEDHLSPSVYSVSVDNVALRRSTKDAREVVRVLKREGRVELLNTLSPSQQIAHFNNRDIFSSMSEIENAAGFRARLDQEIRRLDTKWHRDLVILVALAKHGGAEVSLTEAAFALNTSAGSIISAVSDSDHLGALIEVDEDMLFARHRLQAVDSLIRKSGGEGFLTSLADMLVGLAALLPRGSYGDRTRGSALVRHLMGAKLLHGIYPTTDIDYLFQRIRPQYGDWNARYWEQRSIYARISGNLDPAVSYAQQAVEVHDDDFTRNTLAVNLLSKAEFLADRQEPGWEEYYLRGNAEFAAAAKNARSTLVSRFAKLSATLDLLSALSKSFEISRSQGDVQQIIVDWSASYADYRLALPNIAGSELVRDAEKLSRRFSTVADNWAAEALALGGLETSKESRKDRVSREIRDAALSLTSPTLLAQLAARVRDQLPAEDALNWGGFKTFKSALLVALPDSRILPEKGGILLPAIIQSPSAQMLDGAASVDKAAVLAAISTRVKELTEPMAMHILAELVAKDLKISGKWDWGGFRKFNKALTAAAPDVQIDTTPPMFVVPLDDFE
ncbi:hypothetical protein C5B93_03540 [Rathayibacter sp. AY1A2]|nr:hypothetical protein C5B93_03540 [Rathayibacter sp. AY1A2]